MRRNMLVETPCPVPRLMPFLVVENRAGVSSVLQEWGGVGRAPVPEEQLLQLPLHGGLAGAHGRARLVHHQAHAGRVHKVVLRPVGSTWSATAVKFQI